MQKDRHDLLIICLFFSFEVNISIKMYYVVETCRTHVVNENCNHTSGIRMRDHLEDLGVYTG